MQLVIIAGGKGTRLNLAGGLPKPMVEIGGKPLLEHQILLARKYGISDVLILTGFGAEHIENYFGDGAAWQLRIAYRREAQPYGTAGALLDAFESLQETFLVMYGDTMLNVDLRRLFAFHKSPAAATLFLHPNDHPYDSDLMELNAADQVTAIHAYPHPPSQYFQNLVNAALYVFSKQALVKPREQWLRHVKSIDICKDLFPALLADGAVLQGYPSREYIKDAGTPERLQKVRGHYEAGRVQTGSLETPLPAIFLDRDGTLNYDHGWINAPEKIDLLPGAREAIQAINASGKLAVVITNQPVIARGECTDAQLRRIHNRLEWLLGEAHAYIDALYYCPHHPHAGYPGERVDLKIACACRKPKSGLFEAAVRDLNIDRSRSWMIGDSSSDVEAAENAGIAAALVDRNQESAADQPSCAPRFRARTVLDAVNSILS